MHHKKSWADHNGLPYTFYCVIFRAPYYSKRPPKSVCFSAGVRFILDTKKGGYSVLHLLYNCFAVPTGGTLAGEVYLNLRLGAGGTHY